MRELSFSKRLQMEQVGQFRGFLIAFLLVLMVAVIAGIVFASVLGVANNGLDRCEAEYSRGYCLHLSN